MRHYHDDSGYLRWLNRRIESLETILGRRAGSMPINDEQSLRGQLEALTEAREARVWLGR